MAFSKLAKGYTLIELVSVILVISILAVFVTFNSSGSSINLGAQAAQLANDLRYTQTLSMTKGTRYCLTISSNTYQIANSGTGTGISLALGNTSVTLGTGITFGTLVPAGTGMFVFDGAGTPYYSTSSTCNSTNAAAATSLSTAGSIPLTASGQTRTISISALTGMVSVQ